MSAPATGGSNRPADSNFYNQRLKAWHPILTPRWVVLTFLAIGIVFVPLGGGLYSAANSVVEKRFQYDGELSDTEACKITAPVSRDVRPTCTVDIKIEEEMAAPVYVYYELENFYQNHRRYVKSRSDAQLRLGEGSLPTSTAAARTAFEDCDPLYMGDIKLAEYGNEQRFLFPCGLIANSFFNDTFKIKPNSKKNFTLDETDIAWSSDKQYKFNAVPESVKNKTRDIYQYIDETYPNVKSIEDEHFIVWMRTAALPDFRKLYGRITETIPAGTTISIEIERNFPVDSFGGKKAIVLSTISFLGGKNLFLGSAYMTVGAICLLLAASFHIKELYCPRTPGDVRWLRFPQEA